MRVTAVGPPRRPATPIGRDARAQWSPERWTILPIVAILLTIRQELRQSRMLGALGKPFSSPRSALLKASPWLGGDAEAVARLFALPNGTPAAKVAAARRAATVARLRRGAEAWNEWALAMQALAGQLADDAPALRLWAYLAASDLAGAPVEPSSDAFAGLIFPGAVDFAKARFADTAWFSACVFTGDAAFAGAEFSRGANFERAEFKAAANFDGATFGRAGEFRQAQFGGPARFCAVRFDKDAWFRGGQFVAALDMSGATFGGEAGLGDVRYGGPTSFTKVKFADNAGFEGAIFRDVVRFDDARFERNARFEQARFEREPSFDRARFLGRTFFQGISVPEGTTRVQKAIEELRRRLG
jgi:hypothetical protein